MRPSRRLLHRRVTGSRQIHGRAVTCFHFASGFRITQQLARMLNSLVRVSRRVRWAAIYSPPNPNVATLKSPRFNHVKAEPNLHSSSTTPHLSADPTQRSTCHDRLTDKRALPTVRHRLPRESGSTCRLDGCYASTAVAYKQRKCISSRFVLTGRVLQSPLPPV